MTHIDMHANAALARIEMLLDENRVHAHSISTIMKPVANTFGIDAISGDSG